LSVSVPPCPVAIASAIASLASGESFPLDRDTPIRVGPAERRRVLAGTEGIRMLI
jgi:hypothetical protein